MSIRSKFARSSGWMLLGSGADYAIQFVIFAVLARMLSVAEIGVVALAIVFVEIGRLVANGGYAEAIVQREAWDDRLSSVCFTINLILGVLLSLVMATAGAFAFERYYQQGSGGPVAALSAIFVLEATRAVHSAKLRREFRYRQIATRATIASLLSGIGAVALALSGWGVWALVLQRLVYQSVMNAVTWWSAGWTPALLLDRAIVRELAPFSMRVTLSRTLDLLSNRTADILIGLLFGPVGIGHYRVGARGVDAVNRLAIQPFQDAAFAAFSRVGGPQAIGQAYLRVTRAAALLMFPVHLGSATIATELVVLIFGDKYTVSGPIFAALAFGGVPSTIIYFTLVAYLAAGHPSAMLRASGLALASNLVLVGLIGALYGPFGGAVGVAVTQGIVAIQTLFLLQRYLDLSPRAVLGAVAAPIVSAALMALMLYAVKFFLLPGFTPSAKLAILVALGSVLYPLFLLIGGRRHVWSVVADIHPVLPPFVAARIPLPRPAE